MGNSHKIGKGKQLVFLGLFLIPGLILGDTDPYRHTETLDREGKYLLEWRVDWEESRVIFNVTVKTKGYVGLGLSRKGKMSGADIVIAGVRPNGEPYLSDRHAVGNQFPEEDASQDWILHAARESDTETFLTFSRPFDTCDEDHDLPIHADVTALLWAYGEEDDKFEYHYHNRGVFYTYLLDPDLTPRALKKTEQAGLPNGERFGDWNVWSIPHSLDMPAQDTTYLCSIHKTPPKRKTHIVGYRTILPTEVERLHIHHFMVFRCIPPVGADARRIFEHLVGRQEECYSIAMPMGDIPTRYCREVVQMWNIGQRPNFFPEHVGIPMNPNEYFLTQVHYDNPNSRPGLRINHALEVFYTENLRKHDAALLGVGALPPGSPGIMVPPNSLAHEIYGHCASECTKSMLPSTGIRVFAANLHTHLAGRGVRLRHIRGNKELPWIASDDNYNFNFQQVRQLREERRILPEDTLTIRCIYENADRNGNVTVGGFSTRNEMCAGFIWYYDKIPDRFVCRSELRSEEYRRFVQVLNATWSNAQREMVVTSPAEHAGLRVSEVGTTRLKWTIAKRKQIQDYHRYLPQVSTCPSLIVQEADSPSTRGATPSSLSSSSLFWKRPSSGGNSEIVDPEFEFLSSDPRDFEPYERPAMCT